MQHVLIVALVRILVEFIDEFLSKDDLVTRSSISKTLTHCASKLCRGASSDLVNKTGTGPDSQEKENA